MQTSSFIYYENDKEGEENCSITKPKNYHGKKSKHANHPRLNQLLCAAGLTFLIKNLFWVKITTKFYKDLILYFLLSYFFVVTGWEKYKFEQFD